MAERHYSHTQMSMFSRCPRQYYYRYVRGLKMPPTGAMVFGISLDDGLSFNYEQKVKTETDLADDSPVDVFLSTMRNAAESGEVLLDEDETLDGMEDTGVKLIREHMKTQAPSIFPRSVQHRCQVKAENDAGGYYIETVADLITQDGQITDLKTTKKTPSKVKGSETQFKIDWNHFIQMGLYNVSYENEFGRSSNGTNLIYHVKLKNPTILALQVDLDPSAVQFSVTHLDMVVKAIEVARASNVWYPNRGGMMCSQRQCGFWSICHEECGPSVQEMVGTAISIGAADQPKKPKKQ